VSTDPPFVVEPYSPNCRAVYEEREHVVVGVSPGNSYFGVRLLADLLGWLGAEFRRVDVVVPDSGLVYTYQALGYSVDKATKKARAETNVLRNRVLRGWEASGGPRPGDGVHRMSELSSRPRYGELLRHTEDVLEHHPGLYAIGLRTSREALLTRRPDSDPPAEGVELAMRYLAAELPFFLASADIFGVPSSLCFYHRTIPLAAEVFTGRSPLRPSPRQGYAVVRPSTAPTPDRRRGAA
jgi:cyclo(L-tyrosyl-L-tyrosyl) synthase